MQNKIIQLAVFSLYNTELLNSMTMIVRSPTNSSVCPICVTLQSKPAYSSIPSTIPAKKFPQL